MANTSIIVAGVPFDTGTRVVLWDEPGGYSFYPHGKFVKRDLSLDELRKIINSFYIHHSVTYRTTPTFSGMVARKLSVTFTIDDDINDNGCATIHQLLDVKEAAYSQGGIYNHNGAGVEIIYMPDAWSNPDRYSEENIKKYKVQPHKIVSDTVHGVNFKKVFAPTDAQVQACIKLISGYKKAFPDLELKFPRDENGKFLSKMVEESKKKGLLHHYNITTRKVDALGFPTDYVEAEVNKLFGENTSENRTGIINKIFSYFKK